MTLDKPELKESLNLYRFNWQNGISIELHRLSESGKAEIWSRYSNGSGVTLIDVSELNLLAPRSRDDYCIRLKKLCPGLPDFDWQAAFRWVVPMALQSKRAGEPIIELGKPDSEIKRPEWYAYPFVVKDMVNILFGDRGSLKSKFALFLTLIMMLPWRDNKLGIKAPPKHLRVLKLDYEATQDSDEYEWHRILRGLDMEGAVQLKYRRCDRPLADDVESIAEHADNMKADVIIVDSIGAAVAADLNASEPALRYNMALRQLNRTILAIGHTAKNNFGKRTVFGNSFYENLARNIWEIVKNEGGESDSSLQHIGLKQTKSPPFAPHHKPLAFEFEFEEEDERTFIRKYSPDDIDAFVTDLSTTAIIISCLRDGLKTDKMLVQETGKNINDIRVSLYRLKKLNKVVKINNEWGLISKDEEP